MNFWIRLAIKNITNNRRFSLFFILNLAIGLVGFIALNSFNQSLHDHIDDNLKNIITGDFAVLSSKEPTDNEQALLDRVLGPDKKESRQVRFFSMAAGSRQSRLSEIVGIDEFYPLYGQIKLESQEDGYLKTIKKQLFENSGIWMTRDSAVSMGLKKGDQLKIGKKDFIISNFILEDPDSALTSFEFAPRLYIGLNRVKETGLTQFGSRINYIRFYQYPKGTDIDGITEKLKLELKVQNKDTPGIRLYDKNRINQNLARIIDNFTGYMGLIGIIALFLAGIGAAYLFRSYLNQNVKEIAILMSLGATRPEAYLLFFMQIIFLGMIASIMAIVLSIVLLPMFSMILKGIIPAGMTATTSQESLVLALILGIVGSIIFCLPVISQIHRLKPVSLLQGTTPVSDKSSSYYVFQFLAFCPAILLFWMMSINQTQSFQKGTLFLGGFLGIMLIIAGMGWSLFSACKPLSETRNVIRKISFRNLYRNKVSSLSVFLTIAMGAFLINLVPQLKNGMQEEISRPAGLKIPGFFLFDIQPEQVEPLRTFIKNRKLVLNNVSPIIRGRIQRVNEIEFNKWIEQHREQKSENRSRNRRREFNFSYRSKLDVSESLIDGTTFSSEKFDFTDEKPAEISIAKGFSDRYKISIGDVLEFDIQGIPLSGKVINIRKVQWNSFQPNFFILFQKGVLEDAPKTFLASIPQMDSTQKSDFQNQLVEEFPNISMIDISKTVQKFIGITDRLVFAINFMAYLSILAGMVVLYSIARYETQKRIWEINLLKVLGAGFKDIRKIVLIEFGFIGFMAALFAMVLSLISSYAISYFFFDRLWSFNWGFSLFNLIAICLVCVLTALAASNKAIRQKPLSILQAV